MKLIIISLSLILGVFAQDRDSIVEGSVITIFGKIDSLLLLGDLTSLLDVSVKDVQSLLTSLEFALSNLVSSVIETVFNLVENLLSLVDVLLAEARNSEKLIDDCSKRGNDLKLLKQKISNDADKCRKNFEIETTSVLTDLKKEQDHGEGSISSLIKSLQNCVKRLFPIFCISKAQQKSSLKEIQGIVNKVDTLGQSISMAYDKTMMCLNDVDENGRKLANQIYSEIQLCISEATP